MYQQCTCSKRQSKAVKSKVGFWDLILHIRIIHILHRLKDIFFKIFGYTTHVWKLKIIFCSSKILSRDFEMPFKVLSNISTPTSMFHLYWILHFLGHTILLYTSTFMYMVFSMLLLSTRQIPIQTSRASSSIFSQDTRSDNSCKLVIVYILSPPHHKLSHWFTKYTI
jgi:hypothetical protein